MDPGFLDDLHAVFAGHHHVGNDQIIRHLAGLQQTEALGAVLGLGHVMPGNFQQLKQNLPQAGIVINN